MKTIKLIFPFLVGLIIIACDQKANNEEPSKKQLSTNIGAEELSEDLRQWVGLIDKEMKTNPKRAIVLCNKLIETAHVTKNREGEALGYYERGYTYNYYLGEHDNAFKDYSQALTFYRELNISQAVHECLLEIGSALYSLKLYDKALGYYEQDLVTIQQVNDKQKEAQLYYAIANCHMALRQDISTIIDNYSKSLSILQELKDEVGIATCYNLMGNTYYFVSQDFPQAKKYYLQAAAIFQAENKMQELGNVYYNLGLLHNEMKEAKIARNYFNQAIELGKKYNYPDLVVSGEFQLGKMQASLNNHSQAIKHGLAALSAIQYDELTKAEITYFLSQSYKAIGNKDQALAYSDQTIDLNKKNVKNNLNLSIKENEQRIQVSKFEFFIKSDSSQASNTNWFIAIGILLILISTYILLERNYRKRTAALAVGLQVSQTRVKDLKSALSDASKQMLVQLNDLSALQKMYDELIKSRNKKS